MARKKSEVNEGAEVSEPKTRRISVDLPESVSDRIKAIAAARPWLKPSALTDRVRALASERAAEAVDTDDKILALLQ